MLDKLIIMSTNYLIRRQVIDEDDRDVYEYGFHALYNNIIDIASIIIISILLRQIPQTIFYHLSFIPIRQTAGGYHAKTHLHCFVMSTMIWLLSLWGISQADEPVLCVILAFVSVLLVWVKAPIEHENSPMNFEKYKRMKLLSRIISLSFLVAIIFLTIVMNSSYLWIAAAFAYGMASHTLLMLISLWKAQNKKS